MPGISILDQLPLFEGLTEAQRNKLRPIFVACEYPSDIMIFGQGDSAIHLYIVVEGEVVVNFKPDDGPALTVARVLPGGIVGWSAALGSQAYTSGAWCCANTRLARVRGEDLRQLCNQYPEIGQVVLDRLATAIAERLRSTHAHVVALLQKAMFQHEQYQELNHGYTR